MKEVIPQSKRIRDHYAQKAATDMLITQLRQKIAEQDRHIKRLEEANGLLRADIRMNCFRSSDEFKSKSQQQEPLSR